MSVTKGEKTSFVDRVKKFYRGIAGELKKVHWPNRREITSYTLVVLVSVVLVGAIIWVFDVGLGQLMALLVH